MKYFGKFRRAVDLSVKYTQAYEALEEWVAEKEAMEGDDEDKDLQKLLLDDFLIIFIYLITIIIYL